MKWNILGVVLSVLLCLSLATAQSSKDGRPSAARIKIDLDRKIGEVNAKIYGNFTEHLGRCIYGGIYDPASPRADRDGFRKDVIDATKNLNVSILRWPGGNFVSGYHWEDGIGPREKRPKRIDLAWGDIESNQIGTDEFIRFCRKVGTEPYICINLGTGTWDEARNWVEYCNRKSGTYYSDLRIKNGSPDPHNVKYWALGNEMDGDWQMGHRNAEDYGKHALEAAKLMKWIDPDIKLVVCGSSAFGSGWIDWNRTVLSHLKDYADYIALHTYVGDHGKDYYEFLSTTLDVENRIKIVEGLIKETLTKTRRTSPIYIAFDEYNVWYRAWTDQKLEEVYDLQDALVIAQFLNCFIRNAHIVKIANMAQLVNVIAPMKVDEGKLWLQTIYYPLQLFATNCRGTALQTYVACDTFNVGQRKGVPYLDVSSVYDEKENVVMINVVNRHRDAPIEADILNQSAIFEERAQVYEVNGDDLNLANSIDKQNVKTVEKTIPTGGKNNFTYKFPPHSFTMIKVRVK
jgi:alpha-N-arabinofuranosidase